MNRIRINNRWRIILSLLYERSWTSIEDILPIVPNLKYARRIMQSLIKTGLVKFVQCNFEENKKGPGKNFYALTNKGFRQYFSTEDSFHEPKILTSTGFYHTHIINTFLTGFSVLSKKFPGLIIESAGENEMRKICSKLIEKNVGNSPFCVPDFSFYIGDGIKSKLILAEVDTNTETISNAKKYSITIKNKFAGINTSASLGLIDILSKKFGFDFRGFIYLIIIAGDDLRFSNILETAKTSDVKYPVLAAKFNNFKEHENILNPLFYHIQSNNLVSIVEEL